MTPAQGTGPGTLSYVYGANPSVNARTATITMGNSTFTLTQPGITGMVTLSPGTVSVGPSGAFGSTVTIAANASDFAWTAVSSSPWITISSATAGTGSGTVTYNVGANPSVFSRIGTIVVAGQSLAITQTGVAATVTLPQASENVWSTPGASSFNLVVTPAEYAWLATSSAPWLVVSQTSGVGSATIHYSYGANVSRDPRSATITIAGQVFTVNQAGAPPTGLVLQPIEVSIPMSGAAGRTFSVVSESATWAAVSNVSWIRVVSGTPGSGNGTITYDVSPHSQAEPRTGEIQVGEAKFVIRQEGPTPAPTGPFSGAGSSNTFSFQFSDAQGFQNLDVVNILMNQFLDGNRACYLAYSQPAQRLYLVNDGGPASGLTNGLALGAAGSISNGQCTVHGTGSSAQGNGQVLTLQLRIDFSASFQGSKVVYQAARNQTGENSGWFTQGTWRVPGEPVRFPSSTGVTPGSGTAGRSVISFEYADQSSANNLTTAWALVNTAVDGRRACYVAYYRPGNLLYLYPDNGDGTQATSILLTGNQTIENRQCKIHASGSSVVSSGASLTIALDVEFKETFSGFKGIWTAAQTAAGEVSPWRAVASWRIP